MTKNETYRKSVEVVREALGRFWTATKHRIQDFTRSFREHLQTPEKRKALAYASVRRMGWFIGEILAVALGLIVVSLLYINSVILTGEREDPALRRAARMWISDAFGAHDADIKTFKISWRAHDNTLGISIDDVVIRDRNKTEVERIENIRSYLGLTELLAGQFRPYDIRVTGGQLTIRGGSDGRLRVGLGAPEHVNSLGALWVSPEPQGRSIAGAEAELPETPYRIEVEDVTAYLIDDIRGFNVRADTRQLIYEKDAAHFRGNFEATLNTAIGQAPVKISASGHSDLEYYEVDIEAGAINPADVLMPEGPLSAFRAINLPLEVQARLSHTPETGFKIAALKLEGGAGHISHNEVTEPIEQVKLDVSYDGFAGHYDISVLEIASERVRLSGQGKVQDIVTGQDEKSAYPFNVSFENVAVDARPLFERVLSWNGIDLEGKLGADFTSLDLPNVVLNTNSFRTDISLFAETTEDFTPQRLRVKADVEGIMSPTDLLSLWPVPFADGARRWVAGSVKEGNLRNFKVDMNIDPEAFAAGRLQNEDLSLTFDVDEAVVNYIRTMPPITGAVGSGVLQGNRFDFDIHEGQIGDINFLGGDVEIPLLWPYGGDFTIDLIGEGPVVDMLHLINYKPFEFADRYGVDPESFAGTGAIHMTITRPLLVHFDQSRIKYAAKGQFSDVEVPFSIGSFDLQDGELTLDVDPTGMWVYGPVKIGGWQTQLEWQEIFDDGATPTLYTLHGPLGREGFDSFGIGLREYFSGDVGLIVNAEGRGVSISAANVIADLVDTQIQFGEYWSKEVGEAAKLDFRISRDQDGALMLEDLTAEAEGMTLTGRLSLASDLRLELLELARVEVEDVIDGQLSARLNSEQNAIDVDISGAHFDISPFVRAAINTQTRNVGTGSQFTLPINLNAAVERLDLARDYRLEEAEVRLRSRNEGLIDSHVKGQVDEGDFLISLTPDIDKQVRELIIDIPDASNIAQSFLGLDNISGGRLQLQANLPAFGETGAINGHLDVEDFTLVRAPILARILSLASLQGLAELLGGTGLSFTVFEIPFSWQDGVLSVRNARAAGSALGMTGNGEVDMRGQLLDLDGVLIPAYNTNAMLGNLPVIGDILGGKDDEGVLALNYAVQGPFNRSQVSVNPLSALTPGFIRDIFQPDREELPNTIPKIVKKEEATSTLDEAEPKPDE